MTALGTDAWLYIMSFLRPGDILSLRCTCRYLYNATMHRTVWIYAVNRMMEEHCIPEATFAASSMDNATLEDLALSPARFSLLISDSYDEEIEFYSCYSLPGLITSEEQCNHSIKSATSYTSILLAPGGRFLVTALHVRVTGSQTPRKYIQLWDLGLCEDENGKSILIASSILGQSTLHLRQLSLMPGGYGFYLISSHETSPFSVVVYRITTFAPTPEIVRLNKYDIKGPVLSLATSGSRLAILDASNTITIWDMEANVSTNWTCQVELQEVDDPCIPIHMYDDNVMIYHSGCLNIWRVPELLSGQHGSSQPHRTDVICSDSAKGRPIERDQYQHSRLLPFPSTRSSSRPPYTVGLNTASKLLIYDLRPTEKSTSPRMPSLIPTHIATIDSLGDEKTVESALQACDQNLIYTVIDSEGGAVFVTGISDRYGPVHGLPTKAFVLPPEADAVTHAELCAATGRLCILSGEENVYIIDYIQPRRVRSNYNTQ